MRRSVGLDFGTTNSALGTVGDDGAVSLARFSHRAGASDTFRSILYFHPDQRDARGRLAPTGGARAIDRYLEADGSGRLVQSLKSYLADRLFTSTNVFNKMHSLTELMTMLLVDIRGRAEEQLGELGGRIVVGRPVHFSNADTEEDDAFAEARLTTSLRALLRADARPRRAGAHRRLRRRDQRFFAHRGGPHQARRGAAEDPR
jgi:hypothetical chaperone protein